MMKDKINSVMFIVPPKPACGLEFAGGGAHPPYGFLCLAERIKGKIGKVSIVDCPAQKISAGRLLKIIKREQPDLIGIGAITYHVKDVYDLLAKIKAITDAVIVGGGPHLSYEYREAMDNGFDAICRFSAEESLPALIDSINKGTSPGDIAGVVYRHEGAVIVTRRGADSGDIFPIGNWELIDPSRYWWWFRSPANISLNTSRGCQKSCNFCTLPDYWGRSRRLTAAQVFAMVSLLYKKYGKRCFWFTDDDFLVDSGTFKELCRLFIESGMDIHWGFQTRCSGIIRHKEAIAQARKAGAFFVLLGVETYSNDRLGALNKDISISEIEDAGGIIDKIGLPSWNSFIVGLPQDGYAQLEETYRFAAKLNSLMVTFTPLTPIPGTRLWEQNKKDIDYSRITLYDTVLPTENMKAGALERKITQMYLRYYTRPDFFKKFLNAPPLAKKLIRRLYVSGSIMMLSRGARALFLR
jgi:anaerobic magnesium-protoporphyrin IX monomethyl ester cyclase